MEPRIFRFLQFIESILSNIVPGKEISAKIRGKGSAATPDRKEIISNLFFKKENFSRSPSPAFVSGIFFLFVGFVIGNLFGTFLPAIRIYFSWDGFIVIFLLFFIEFISYIRYQGKSRFFLILWNWEGNNGNKIAISSNFPFFKISLRRGPYLKSEETTTFGKRSFPFSSKGLLCCSLNYFKIGFLLGFFIDAYKVGS